MKEPLRNIELLKVFANAVVVWAVVMDFWPLDSTQQAVTLTVVMSGINLLGAWWQGRETTSLAEPKDTDGVELTRPNDVPANKKMESLQTEAIEINKSGTRPE